MNSFLENNYILIYRGVEILAALIGLIYLRKYRDDKAAKYFIYFLVYVQFVEFFGAYPRYLYKYESLHWIKEAIKGTLFKQNYWWYTIFWTIGSSVFFATYFYISSNSKSLRKSIKWVTISCLVLSVFVFIMSIDKIKYNYLILLDVLNLVIIVSLAVLYFIQLLNSESILSFYKMLSFYICSGILVFWIVTTPLMFYEEYYNVLDKGFIALKKGIYLLSIIFMYLIFAIGLIVSDPEKNN